MTEISIICPEDTNIEINTLKDFPFPPQKGDHISISGITFEVVRREFRTNSGTIDATGGTSVVLKKV